MWDTRVARSGAGVCMKKLRKACNLAEFFKIIGFLTQLSSKFPFRQAKGCFFPI
jgi:hypothetical protein